MADNASEPDPRTPSLRRISVILASGFWLGESLLHRLLFAHEHKTLLEVLVPQEPNELWMRGVIVTLILGFGWSAERLLAATRRANDATRTLLKHTTDAYLAVDRKWRIVYLNNAALELFQLHRTEAVGEPLWDILPEMASSFFKPLQHAMDSGTVEVARGPYPARQLWLEAHCAPAEDGMTLYFRDITEQRERERILQRNHRRMQSILDNAGDAIVTINPNGNIETFNRAAERMFGYSAAEAVGRNVAMLMPQPEAAAHDGHISQYLRTGVTHIIDSGPREVTACRRDGSTFPTELAVTEMREEEQRLFIGIMRDITERKAAQAALEYLSNFDELTDLPNRTLLHDRLGHAVRQAHRDEHLVAVMFLDLDRFKTVNDTLGHAMGDKLLQTVARRIKSAVREGDTVARLGGDEFVILLEGIHHVDNAAHVANKILESLSDAIVLGIHEVVVTASIGITIYPFDDDNIDDLLKDADAAMYRAKARGKNTYQYYTADMTSHAVEHMTLERDLRRALEREEFELYYQPQLDLASDMVVGVEALLRWHHPERGMVSPGEFIPMLEEAGLILPVGDWVLQQACRQNRQWQDQGLPALRVGVNLSALQFRQRHMANRVSEVLHETGLAPRWLDLEITEGVLVENVEATIDTLRQLSTMGVSLSIDDFGTGYSSMNYLKRFPLDTLKIDQSFVRDVTCDPDSAAIAEAIIALAHSLRLKVIAEGVETEAQQNYLQAQGCHEVQGYYYARPMPAAAFEHWMEERSKTS